MNLVHLNLPWARFLGNPDYHSVLYIQLLSSSYSVSDIVLSPLQKKFISSSQQPFEVGIVSILVLK